MPTIGEEFEINAEDVWGLAMAQVAGGANGPLPLRFALERAIEQLALHLLEHDGKRERAAGDRYFPRTERLEIDWCRAPNAERLSGGPGWLVTAVWRPKT